MSDLAFIAGDPIEVYLNVGYEESQLVDYFNPLGFFDKVYLLSPLEKKEMDFAGTHIIPTKPKELPRRLVDLDIDLVYARGVYWPCDMACKNKAPGVPVVVSANNADSTLFSNSIKYADFVFCIGKILVDMVKKKGVNGDRIFYVPNQVDLDVFKRLNGSFKSELSNRYRGKYKILHVGRKERQKNPDTLIRSLKMLGEEYICVFIGRGHTERYKELAEREGVLGQCYFVDSVPNKELAKYYSWCDCMCVPSRWEGFGGVFLEALACQSVVVTSDIPMNEFIRNGFNGLLVKEYENPAELAECIRKACTDQDLRERLISNARNSVAGFSKEKVRELEVEKYRMILNIKNSGKFRQIKTPLLFIAKENAKNAASKAGRGLKNFLRNRMPGLFLSLLSLKRRLKGAKDQGGKNV